MNQKEEIDIDPYAVLGISDHSVSTQQISKAARKMGLKYHPDKNPDPAAQETFLLVQKAKDILLDSDKRKEYDEIVQTKLKRKQHEEQRTNAMDEQRKKYRDELRDRLSSEQKSKSAKVEADQNAKKKVSKPIRKEAAKGEVYEHAMKVKWNRSRSPYSLDELIDTFGCYGNIRDVFLKDKTTNAAIVVYDNSDEVVKAINAFQNSLDFKVSFATQEDSSKNENKEKKKASIFTFQYAQSSTEGTEKEDNGYSSSSHTDMAVDITQESGREQAKDTLTAFKLASTSLRGNTLDVIKEIERAVSRQALLKRTEVNDSTDYGSNAEAYDYETLRKAVTQGSFEMPIVPQTVNLEALTHLEEEVLRRE